MKADLIKKLRLKKGCKYILIIPDSAGLSIQDIVSMDKAFIALGIMVKTTRGIKVMEVPE